ncbi:hypothetical protein ACFS7Z_22680 [Pontibacter toksunensis]|uniref:Uncharacterized protein n=1 Tax=Pontibacter toksunensis TaxID=1332631 RepID=A0ABW6C075_9BACT
MKDNNWNSLEKAKFIVSVLSTIITLTLTIGLFYYGNKVENAKWRNQTLITKKLELYESMMPKFNAILCYMNHFGTFKEHSPKQIIDFKRELNLEFYTNKDFFSKEFQNEYLKFIDTLCFKPYSGQWDSKIKKQMIYSKAGYEEIHGANTWQSSWNDMFSNNPSDKVEISASYYRMMDYFMNDMGFKE